MDATYREITFNNNVFCGDINAHKQCAPEVLLAVTVDELIEDFRFVRGYEGSSTFIVNATNLDSTFDILSLDGGRNNFNLTLFYSDVDVFVDEPVVPDPIPIVISNGSDVLRGGADVGDTLVFTGMLVR